MGGGFRHLFSVMAPRRGESKARAMVAGLRRGYLSSPLGALNGRLTDLPFNKIPNFQGKGPGQGRQV